MSRLRIADNLIINDKVSNVACKVSLICDCKNEHFYVRHTGKQTRGIFRPLLVKSNKQISIVCQCKNCGKEIKVYDSTVDGLNPLEATKANDFAFALKDRKVFRIFLYYNYFEEDFMTNRFVDCFIHITDEDNKEFVLYE